MKALVLSIFLGRVEVECSHKKPDENFYISFDVTFLCFKLKIFHLFLLVEGTFFCTFSGSVPILCPMIIKHLYIFFLFLLFSCVGVRLHKQENTTKRSTTKLKSIDCNWFVYPCQASFANIKNSNIFLTDFSQYIGVVFNV